MAEAGRKLRAELVELEPIAAGVADELQRWRADLGEADGRTPGGAASPDRSDTLDRQRTLSEQLGTVLADARALIADNIRGHRRLPRRARQGRSEGIVPGHPRPRRQGVPRAILRGLRLADADPRLPHRAGPRGRRPEGRHRHRPGEPARLDERPGARDRCLARRRGRRQRAPGVPEPALRGEPGDRPGPRRHLPLRHLEQPASGRRGVRRPAEPPGRAERLSRRADHLPAGRAGSTWPPTTRSSGRSASTSGSST